MPTSTSMVMVSFLAWQFVKLQAPPCSGSEGEVPPFLRSKPVSSLLILEAWRRAHCGPIQPRTLSVTSSGASSSASESGS